MQNLPPIIESFKQDLTVIRGRSIKTVEQYEIDLTIFFKYIIAERNEISLEEEEFNKIDIRGVDIELIKSITREEIYMFLGYTNKERENIARTRARKLSSLKALYKYLTVYQRVMENNPVADIDSPKIKSTLPKYLTIEESLDLLKAVREDRESKTRERDYAILTVFLNSGMRLSELVNINMSDMDKELHSVRILGKGSKERIIYINESSREALTAYIKVRSEGIEIKEKDKNALFLSSRRQRISIKTVQWMVYKYLAAAGLEYKHFSTHKLRHTAATLMYQTGKVDVRVLKDILGHEQLNTTQIYTHVSDEHMEKAMYMNPLGKMKKGGEGNDGTGEEKT